MKYFYLIIFWMILLVIGALALSELSARAESFEDSFQQFLDEQAEIERDRKARDLEYRVERLEREQEDQEAAERRRRIIFGDDYDDEDWP